MELRKISLPATYVIAVKDGIVLMDLEETVRDFDATARIISVGNWHEAVASIQPLDRIAIAFVEASPKSIRESELYAQVLSRGGRIVYLGKDAEDEWDKTEPAERLSPTLIRPFTSENIRSMFGPRKA